ncbi:pyruvate dehydrogenase (acetyl-transferring) E1 component subunit alpha [Legionella sp. W05-934-2]|uniref:pyruvate dehydrogenase (acetyl-transferring) E1 component subunit alpha n=1 Tax=Legionella sp. W05-934-2 TaxID=1198649 RepID=UPI0034630A3F
MNDSSFPLIQYLNEHGEVVRELPQFAHDKATLTKLYKIMSHTRLFDKKAIALQRTGKMGTYAPINGQEAIGTAIGYLMQAEDVFVPYYRDYACQFQRGVSMTNILSYWGGDERGSDFENNSHDLPICVPIASQFLHAAGVAFALKYRKKPQVAVACIGDGGTSEGDFYEALNVAGAWNLPVVFVVNNNQWAISVPLSQQTCCETIAQKSVAAGIEGHRIDGNDIIACTQVIGQAIEKARSGGGPSLIEAVSYRLSDHTTADDATRYQPADDVSKAEKREPLHRVQMFLKQYHQWQDADENSIVDEGKQLVQEAVDAYLSMSPQPVTSIFDYHFAQMPDYLKEQREMAMEEVTHG